jgi:lipid II:glycine glycyltransferase (peptidoglycan interpeptide bridge formation enzyme)
MNVKEITRKDELESFIRRIKPHTFLSSWEWGTFEEKSGRKVWRLGVYENNVLIAVATMSKTVARRATFLVWHQSPIIDPAFSSNLKKIVEELRNSSKEIAQKEGCHFIRVSTILADTKEHQELFKELGFRPAPIHFHSELGWLLDLTVSEDDLLKGMRKNTRYALRKAEKDGVTVTSSSSIDDFETFWTIYMETVKRQKFTPYSRQYLYNEFETFLSTGHALLWFGHHNNEVISTAFVVYTENSAFYHHGASVHRTSGVSASELVQWEAIKEAKRRGATTYNFWGVVPETAEKHPWFGLSRFKRGFGGFEEAYLHAQDYILKPWYWVNFAIEMYRKIKRGV